MKNEHNQESCVYCLNLVSNPNKDRDHVPGKQFFPDPKPSIPELITVPCCRRCQKTFKKDEDYVRSFLCFGPAGVTPIGKKLWKQKLARTYVKDLGLRNLIGKSFRQVDITTPGGIYIGNRLSVDPKWPKIRSFITKLVKGLYYFEYDEVLPKSAMVQTSEQLWFFSDDLTSFLKMSRNGKRCWEGVFEYRTNRVAENPLVSMWM